MKYGHNCFSNKICVKANGEVTPCIMEKMLFLATHTEINLKKFLKLRKTNESEV